MRRSRFQQIGPVPLTAVARPGARQGAVSLRSAAEWITRREIVWLVLLSPLFLFPGRWGALVLGALPALWAARWVARGRLLPRTPLDWPIALLTAMVLVSLFATFSIEYSLSKVLGVLFGVALYYAIVEWATHGGSLRWSTAGYLVAGAGLALVGLVGTNWMNKLEALSGVTGALPRLVRGLPGAESGFHPNEVGGALLWIMLPALALTIRSWVARRPVWERAALTALTVFLGITLALTQSRGAITSAVVGIAALLFVLSARTRFWLAGALLVGAAIILASGPGELANRMLDPTTPGAPTSDPANLRVRLEIWSSALAAVKDAPLTGIGMNTFREVMPTRYPSSLIPPDFDIGHAHNIFLQTTLDLGLPGLLAFTAILVVTCMLLARAYYQTDDTLLRTLAAGLGAGLLASLIFGVTDAIALGARPGVFFWATLALSMIIWQRTASTPARVEAPNQ